jgi:hypothetical protein
VSAGPGTDSGSGCDEQGRDDEEGSFQYVRCRATFDEPPYDVVAIEEIGEESGAHDALMDQRLMPIFELSGLHC